MNRPICLAALICAVALAAPASAESDKPWAEGKAPTLSAARAFPALTIIYRFTGARSSAVSNLASAVHCTNWGPAATVQINVRRYNGAQSAALRFALPSGATKTTATKSNVYYSADHMFTGAEVLDQGSFFVYSTTPHVQCSAVNFDAAGAVPVFVEQLGAQRLNPPAGVTE